MAFAMFEPFPEIEDGGRHAKRLLCDCEECEPAGKRARQRRRTGSEARAEDSAAKPAAAAASAPEAPQASESTCDNRTSPTPPAAEPSDRTPAAEASASVAAVASAPAAADSGPRPGAVLDAESERRR
jgi:hypothetical protein